MPRFATTRDAKEFLVARIVTEAQRQGIPLSEIEKKMMYFSETAWTLPDIADVNDAFDREYDQAEYEQKIAQLIRKARAGDRAKNQDEYNAWNRAVGILRKEDHYLLVMIDAAGGSGRSRSDLVKLFGFAIAVFCVIKIAVALLAKYG